MGDTGPGVHLFTFFEMCVQNIDAKNAYPGPVLLLSVWPGFVLIAVYRKYTNGDDATTVVVLFCRQTHLRCTDMGLQQNRDKKNP